MQMGKKMQMEEDGKIHVRRIMRPEMQWKIEREGNVSWFPLWGINESVFWECIIWEADFSYMNSHKA